jgi:hypothetical protein
MIWKIVNIEHKTSTVISGSIQDTATTEDDIWRQTTSPTTKTDQDGTVENLAVMGRLRQHQDYS